MEGRREGGEMIIREINKYTLHVLCNVRFFFSLC